MSSSSVADTGQSTVYPREAVLGLLRRYGRSPLSFLLRYEAPWEAFLADEGAVAYLPSRGAAVVWSDPLCAPPDIDALLRTFTRAMRVERLGICLVAVASLAAYEAEFEPSAWEPRYVACSPPWARPRVIRAAVRFLDA